MDITSPSLLKLKALLFVVLGVLAAVLLLAPDFSFSGLILLGITVWAFCRAYYFGFYVLHHYVDPRFRYSGLGSMILYLWKHAKTPTSAPGPKLPATQASSAPEDGSS